MKNLIIYETATGRIKRTTTCLDEDEDKQTAPDESAIEGTMVISDLLYILDGVITERPQNPAKLAGDTIYDIPVPSVLRIDGDIYDIHESTVELELPDTNISIFIELTSPFPYLKKVF